jgi:hypothetical protein
MELILLCLIGQLLLGTDSGHAAPNMENKDISSSAQAAFSDERRAQRQKTERAPDATLSGQILIQGNAPVVNWMVYLFNKTVGPPPSKDKYWRVPDLISTVDKDGKFSLAVSEGEYYLTAAQKDPNGELGPPTVSELHYFHGDAEWNPVPLTVTSGAKLNLGILTRVFMWTPEMITRDKGITSIEGVVTDMGGKPLERALVFAYLSKEVTGRPVFISERTDKNGRYLLRVHDGGTFFLKVRSVYGGGVPEAGEFLNITEEFKPFWVTLKKDQKLQGINLQVKKFQKRGPANTKQ